MSKNSDLIKEYVTKSAHRMHEQIVGDGDPDDHQSHAHMISSDQAPAFAEDPMFFAQLLFYNQKSLNMVRRVSRQAGGAELWANAGEATLAVNETLGALLIQLPFQALADGIQVTTDDPSFAVKKYTRMGALEDIYNSEVFCRDSELIAMEYLADEDSVEVMKSMLLASVYHIGSLSGFKSFTGNDLYHVWDVFLLAIRSITTSMYLAGRELGQHVAEEDALAGILAATERQEK